ncbi:hypothetical protein A3759_18170 [Thalassolituus sp. HI0120]|nr:hypothetical protein A3759_18170 [Thalassolituus sp. HI0120]
MKNLISLLFLISASAFSNTDVGIVENVTIEWLRIHSSMHETAEGIASIKVSGVPSGGCSELIVSKDDKATLSVLLSAKAKASNVDVHFKQDGDREWPGGCWILAVTEK